MKVILFAFIFIYNSFVFAAGTLGPETVVQSSLKHYPEVLKSIYKLEKVVGLEREAVGAFDASLQGGINSRDQGFYDGKIYQGRLVKPFPFLNSKVYGGYRVSEGTFPGYEGKMETLDGGEQFLGVSLSLLRGATIDTRRFDISLLKEDVKQEKLKLKRTRLDIQNLALKSYWTWVVKGYELKVYSEILDLAKNRGSNIKRRIRSGDLARIYNTENLQYIRKREVLVKEGQQQFQEASFYLSLFHRNSDGQPVMPDKKNLPELDFDSLARLNDISALHKIALERNLELKIYSSQEKQADATIQLGENELLPKLDVSYEWSRDEGVGPENLAQDEGRIAVSLEIPLEFNKGRGKQRAGKMKKEIAKTKLQFMREKLKTQLGSLVGKINTSVEVTKINREQVELARKLVEAEVKKFKRGSSDLILINLREENLAESQIKNLSNFLKYQYQNADIKSLLVDFI